MKKDLVSIVIPAYRAEYFISNFIGSINNIRYSNFEVVMVFDPSTDKGPEIAKQQAKKKKNWKIIVNKQHLGFSKSLNLGIENCKGRYIFFLMTDEFIDPDCINKLVSYFQNAKESVGVVVAKTFDFHQHDRIQTYRMYLMPQTGLLYVPEYGLRDSKKYNKPFTGFSGIDGAMFKKEVFEKVGLFDTDIDLLINDLDMIWKTWIAGFKVVKIPSAKIYHWSLKIGRSNVNWEFAYAKMGNLFIQNYSLKYLLLYLPQLIAVYTARSFVTLLSGNSDPIKGWIKAIFWSVGYLPKALKKRKIVQNQMRVVSDEYLHDKIFGKLSLWAFYKHIRWVQKIITPIMITKEAGNDKILTYSKYK